MCLCRFLVCNRCRRFNFPCKSNHFKTHLGNPHLVQPQCFSCCVTAVNNSPFDKRPSVIDADNGTFSVLQVGYFDHRIHWPCFMGSRMLVHIVTLTVTGQFPVKIWSVPAGDPLHCLSYLHIGRLIGTSKYRITAHCRFMPGCTGEFCGMIVHFFPRTAAKQEKQHQQYREKDKDIFSYKHTKPWLNLARYYLYI